MYGRVKNNNKLLKKKPNDMEYAKKEINIQYLLGRRSLHPDLLFAYNPHLAPCDFWPLQNSR